MKALLIAEKPDLMRKVRAVYDKFGHTDEIDFISFAGHTMTLQEPGDYKDEWVKWNLNLLPMIPEIFKFKPTSDKLIMYREIKNKIELGRYDYLINCCDSGREGQLIMNSFYKTIECKLPVKRMWHSDLTENELNRALCNLRDDLNDPFLKNMTSASNLRAEFDWLIGMNFTRAFDIRSNSKAALGRVMTPTLKILVDRELEIKNFKPKDFWEIEAEFKAEKGIYNGIYFYEDNQTQILDKKNADAIIKTLTNNGKIISVEENKETKYAPPLHSLSNLQNEANQAFGYTLDKTLEIAQNLYEKQLLSYPRTDSAFLTSATAKEFGKLLNPLKTIKELETEVNAVIVNKSLLERVAINKKYVDDKKVTDHYAITPTGINPDYSKLSKEELNIYHLVAKRFLSIFLPPMVSNKTIIITEDNKIKFKTNGNVIVDKGFTRIYNTSSKELTLPQVKKNEDVSLIGTNILSKKTSPPQRYTDRTLNMAMENPGKFIDEEDLKEVLKEAKGIGTPATRGKIVDKITTKNKDGVSTAERRGKGDLKYFHATEYGISIILSLKNQDITSPKLTGEWEQKLRLIEACKYDPNVFRNEMIEFIKNSTEVMKAMEVNISNNESKEAVGKCPICGDKVVTGKDYYFCAKYKSTCTFIMNKEYGKVKLLKADITSLLNGKETKEHEFTYQSGSKGKAKLILTKDFKLKFSFGERNDNTTGTKNVGEKEVIAKCPKCDGSIIDNNNGFYSCSNYTSSNCKFMISKTIKGAKIDIESAKKLIAGEQTKNLTFVWANGKTGSAKIKLKNEGGLEFIFDNN